MKDETMRFTFPRLVGPTDPVKKKERKQIIVLVKVRYDTTKGEGYIHK